VTRSFNDPPNLPPLHKFSELTEPVDYIYQLVPILQAILNCFKDRITDLDRPFPAESAIRALLDQIGAAIAGLANELAELRAAMHKALTRADVIRIVKGMLTMEEVADQTAVGVVKCIACGREMRQVAGALTEEDALRLLGEPSTSLVRVPSIGVPLNQLFASPKSFDSVDSPRAARPARRPRVRRLGSD
jgi:bacterioferritin-associated ferredoxin